MAKYSGGVSGDMLGSIGGVTFGRNKSGGFARNRTKPNNPRTPLQLSQRSKVAEVSQLWRNLFGSTQIQWHNLALQFPRQNKLGKTYFFSGEQMHNFCRLNSLKVNPVIPGTVPNIAQNNVPIWYGLAFDVITTPGSESVKYLYLNTLTSAQSMYIECSGVVSAGVSLPKKFKFIGVFPNTATSPVDFTSLYAVVFGSLPQPGDKLFIRGTIIDSTTGFHNVPQVIQTIAHI